MTASRAAKPFAWRALPEAKLAREAEMCFAVLATSTDYDAWHEVHEDVTAEVIIANLQKNVAVSQRVLRRLVPVLDGPRTCACTSALAAALVTALELVPEETLKRLGPLVKKYVS